MRRWIVWLAGGLLVAAGLAAVRQAVVPALGSGPGNPATAATAGTATSERTVAQRSGAAPGEGGATGGGPPGVPAPGTGAAPGGGAPGDSAAAGAAAGTPALADPGAERWREAHPVVRARGRRLLGRLGVKGVYLSAASASLPERVQQFLHLVERTEINAVVIDVKTDWGTLAYPSVLPLAREAGTLDPIQLDLPALLRAFKERGAYTIARVVTFKDNVLPRRRPDLAVQRAGGGLWQDYKGLTWLNPYSRAAWDYVVGVAREVAQLGFDEIQFDYVRFPSDGPMASAAYPGQDGRRREQVIGDFLAYAREQLAPLGVWVAADIFGIVLSVPDDQGIGHLLEEVARGPDVLSPMVYPSHYAPGNLGLANPNSEPYETVKRALADAQRRLRYRYPDLVIRPWLQDFSWGWPYGPAEVRAQIRAAYENGLDGWMLWNAANVYTEAALLPKGAPPTAAPAVP